MVTTRSYKENCHHLRLVLSISIRMVDTTIGSELMIIDEGGSTDDYENSKGQKHIDSTDNEKTS